MPDLSFHFEKTEPLYRQIYDSLRLRILIGELRSGEHVPPIRELAQDLGVSRSVVIAAYRELLSEGYLQARVGHGTWVSHDLPDRRLTAERASPPSSRASAAEPRLSQLAREALAVDLGSEHRQRSERRSSVISFSLDSVAIDTDSSHTWNRLLQKRMRSTPGEPAPADSPELRQALAMHLRRSRGISAEHDQILIFAGAGQCIDLIGRALLQSGSTVLMEDPGRRSVRLTLEAAGARVIPCPVDREGLDVTRPAAGTNDARRTGPCRAKLAYVTPAHQIPTGQVMSQERRRYLLAWASAADAMIVEDDRDAELHYEGRPMPAIHAQESAGRVIYVGTISRALCTDMRMAYAVLPRSLVQPIAALRSLAGSTPPIAAQTALADFILGEHYDRHLRRLHQQMTARRRVLLDSLEDRFGEEIEITGASAGLHIVIWLREPTGSDAEQRLLATAEEIGVEVSPLSPHSLIRRSRLGFALCYAGLSESEIYRGVHRLLMTWRAACRAIENDAAANGQATARTAVSLVPATSTKSTQMNAGQSANSERGELNAGKATPSSLPIGFPSH